MRPSTAVLTAAPLFAMGAQASACYCMPGDSCWPSATTWSQLNTTVEGRLIATVPIGSPCHDPNYDAAACAALQGNWTLPTPHLESSSSVMEPYFANQSCDPFTAQDKPCVLGNYVSYAVNVSSTADVVATVNFAKKNNIRLVIRNTGHDFFGRSTGAAALAVWTHNLDSMEVTSWSDSTYSGPAMKLGAGVLGYTATEFAHDAGLVVVGGECPTVGLAGGFTQGGGHSALSTEFGLAADQTLEFEVVTAAGTVVTASWKKNPDLYWALSGGGPGTYGIVTSMTIRAFPDANIGGASLAFAAAYTTQDKFNEAVTAFHAMLPNMTDLGASVGYLLTNEALQIDPVTVYNSTAEYVQDTVLAPFVAKLAELGIPSSTSYTTLSYYDHYATYMGPLPNGHLAVESYQFGSRLIPRSVIETNNEGFNSVVQNLTSQGVIAGVSAGSFANVQGATNAAHPAWRSAIMQMQLITLWDNSPDAWDENLAAQKQMTNNFVPQLNAITPGSGTYVNEADFNQPNWKVDFFGPNYNKLLAIKNKWDPNGAFYSLKGVGSDAWTVASDGRMCRA
ncbi:putative FAD-binding PCMH-type domain-containing protein [Seiridium cardinale]